MKHNKDNPYPTKDEAMKEAIEWTKKHSHEYKMGIDIVLYYIPSLSADLKTIALICKYTHRTIRKLYFKESEAQ